MSPTRLVIAGAAMLAFGCGAVTPPQTPQQALDKALVSDFMDRVDRYMDLHNELQRRDRRQTTRDDINENLVSRQALASRIRYAREDAQPGDLFTPPIAMALRRAMDPALRGDASVSARESIRDEAPDIFVLEVNGDYPSGASRSVMPGSVLKILPRLPDGLEYRIVDTHLLLMDLDANIVVDYVRDVMCATC